MTQERQDFLLEIGTEELPPNALKTLSVALGNELENALQAAELAYESAEVFASPRRLAVRINQCQARQSDKQVERKGPAKKAAFDDQGQPTKAAEGFARSCGLSVDQLEEMDTPKGVWLVARLTETGQPTPSLLPQMVETAVQKLPIPKRMRWGDSDVSFVRPVHWVVMLWGQEVLPVSLLGKTAGNQTYGHRFHAPGAIVLPSPRDYEVALRQQGYVEPDFAHRRARIETMVQAAAESEGGRAEIDPALLDEVTALNEWPSAVVGDFDTRFLSVPPEALISAMKGHQKYFHLLDTDGQLMAKFITITNIESRRPASVKEGNERVIRPRLSDARFFWDQDRKQPLDDFLPRLKTVVFQQKLGTLFDKVERLETLAVKVGRPLIGEGVSAAQLERAARLSKCDLMTEMVDEFPDLQGVMGRYYAQAQKEEPVVADAIESQYRPRFAGDALPDHPVGQALAIADKLDTITGIYGIGQIPKGDKDPFALRRSALGLLRIMIEKQLDLDLMALIEASLALHAQVDASRDTAQAIYEFMIGRLRAYYLDQGVTPEQFEAVRVCRPTHPLDFDHRMDAVRHFSDMEEAQSLSAANKRIANILKKVTDTLPEEVNTALFEQPEEKALFEQLDALRESVSESIAGQNYREALMRLAAIRETVDAFFDEVMVMAKDDAVKQNRLALLSQIYGLFGQVADISRLSN
ncbi:glycine--tRNA ligase subunit beta [Thiomicrospira sp. WB1]|uniref:glycine--tRNA ligase subunit beta n=1 Tax=Thiomicrospira sp. WB1 TaxID=1685380 RepID=UPI000746191A|nr:glycine--tRNA ligase subunit beta [Thiomicrospira sp. WB1]KUJ72592.1 glycine--tRNA ligase subunit beta [Thiomicrospira sp. WB1]